MMKNKLILNIFIASALGCSISCKINAQRSGASEQTVDCPNHFDSLFQSTVFTKVDTMPEFPGGSLAVIKYFSSNYKVSKKADEFQGSFNFEIIVDVDGKLKGARIKGKKTKEYSASEKEALLVLQNMPVWKPGKCMNTVVPVLLNLPMKL